MSEGEIKMKKRIISILLTACMVMTLLPGLAQPAMAAPDGSGITGDGTSSNPYIITTADQLAYVAQQVNNNVAGWNTASYKIINNIDLSSYNNWVPIGSGVANFGGIFDGGGYTISNLTQNREDGDFGLFGTIWPAAGVVRNITLTNVVITATNINYNTAIGAIAGYNYGTIENCSVAGTISATSNAGNVWVGGITGRHWRTVRNCYSMANVSVTGKTGDSVGGIVGHTMGGEVTNCYSTGSVSGSNAKVGAIVGDNLGATASNCYWRSGSASVGIEGGGTANNISSFTGTDALASHVTIGGTSYSSLVGALNARVNELASTDLKTWTSSASYPVFSTAWTPPTYDATVTVNKDGSQWTSGAPVINLSTTYLANGGITATSNSNGVYAFSNLVPANTYFIWEKGTPDTYTGLYVQSATNAATLNYYSLSLAKGTGIASVSGVGIYLNGKSANINATLLAGYEWDKWSDNNTTQSRSFTVTEQTSLIANGKLKEATVPTLTGTNPPAVTFGYTTAPSMKVSVTSPDTTNFDYTYTWYAGSTAQGTAIASATTDTYTAPTALTAGNHNYTVRVTATNKADTSKTASADKTFAVTVNKESGSGSVTMAGWTYGVTASNPVPTSSTNGTASVTYQYKGRNGTTYTETATKPTNAGDYTVTATFAAAENYNQCTATAEFTIAKAKVTLPTAATGLVYNSSEQSGVASADPRYTVLNGKATNAGGHTATATLVDQANYEWNISTPSSADQSIEWSIAKAPVTFVVTNNNLDYNAGARSATVAQTSTEVLKIPVNGYAVSYAQSGSAVAGPTNKGSYDVVVTISDPNFKHASTADAASKVGTLTINETTYPQAASMTWPTAANLTYGQKLSDSTLSGGDQATKGSYTWKDGTSVPTVTNSGYTVVFTPTDTNYAPVEHTVPVTVAKAMPALSLPTASAITYGQKLSVSALTGGAASTTYNGVPGTNVPGTFAWTVPDTMPSVSDSGVTDYALTFTPTDSLNYNVVTTGKIMLTVDQKEVGLTWSGHENLVYSGSNVNVTATATGLVGADACTATVTEGNKTDAGNYIATATTLSNPNYKLPAVNTLSYAIAKAPVTFVVSGNSYTYDGGSKTATVTQTAGQTPAIAAGDFSVSYQKSGDASGTADKTDAGSYDVIVTISDNNLKFEGQEESVRTFKVGTLTIGKKSITALWKNLHHVYDGTTRAASFALTGVESVDIGNVSAQISGGEQKNVGLHNVTADLTGTRAANYKLTNPSGTLVIQKAPVTFTVSDDMVKHDGLAKIATVTATANSVSFTGFTVTYRKDGKKVETPTDMGSYDIYAEFTNTNYRHVDGTDGTARKIGVLNIYKDTAPATFKLSFASGEGGSGSMTSMTAAQAGTARALPVCAFTKTDSVFGGWQYNGKTYQPGEVLEQPSSNITLTAFWIKSTFTISGVVDQNGNPAADAVVTLMLGSRQIAETVTDGTGKYSFANVAPGMYNLVVSKNGVTQTTKVDIVAADVSGKNITLPIGKTNSVVQVASGSPAIVVGNLEKTFAEKDNSVYTAADKAVVTNGGSVEIKLTAKLLTGDKNDEDQSKIAQKANGTVALFLDLKLEKTVTSFAGITTTTNVPVSNVLLETVIQLPGELQGKSDYTVCRLHDGKLDTITTNPNADGEYIKVNSDKTTLTVYCKNFSTYAIAYTTYSGGGESSSENNAVLAPSDHGKVTVAPEKPSPNNKVTITAIPDKGYKVDTVTVTDSMGNKLKVEDNGNNTYSYVQPSGKVTITVTFKQADGKLPWNPFADVTNDSWFHDAVKYVYENNLMNGAETYAFEPDTATTRGMIVTVLFRMEGGPTGFEKATFSDVAADSYYANAIGWGFKNGIVKGYDKSLYGPEDNITREQLASILYRYAEFKKYDLNKTTSLEKFADGKETSDYAKNAISWAVGNGLLAGKGDSVLDPTGEATRAEVATILMRFDDKFGKKA